MCHLFHQFLTADVYGVFCWAFADFGDAFEVVDVNGEEPKELFISAITMVTLKCLVILVLCGNGVN